MPPHDEGTLIFCSHCGAPQVQLSEELQTQLETQASLAADGASSTSAPGSPSLIWAGATRFAALAAAVAAGLLLVSLVLPPVIFLTFLWAGVSPVVVLGLFQTRFPAAPISSGFGARLGFLTGLSIALVFNILYAITMLVARFVTHTMGDADKQMTMLLDQFRTQTEAQPGGAPPAVQAFLHNLALPEFRAGFMLLGVAMMTCLLLAITTTGGAFAGFVRSRSRR